MQFYVLFNSIRSYQDDRSVLMILCVTESCLQSRRLLYPAGLERPTKSVGQRLT